MLKLPFKGEYAISQKFGQNLNDFYQKDGLLGHTGIDWAMPTGVPVISPCDGRVSHKSTDLKKGEGVKIDSDEIFQYNGQACKLECTMWHLKDESIVVKVGQKVKVGELLGLSNNTGQSTGPHLHFSVRPLSTDGNSPLAWSNGYRGAIDPMPYLEIAQPLEMVQFSHTWNVSKEKVKDFQTKNGLKPDGVVGPKTQAALDILI